MPEDQYSDSFVERLDMRQVEHRREREREEHQRELRELELREVSRRERFEKTRDVMVTLILVVGALVTLIVIWQWVTGPKAPDHEMEREEKCISDGGGWVPKDMLETSIDDHGICVFPGKSVG